MEPIINPWFFYLIDALPRVATAMFTVIGVIVTTVTIMAIVHYSLLEDYHSGREEYKSHKKSGNKCIVSAALFAFLFIIPVLIPSKEAMIQMAVASQLTTGNIEIIIDVGKALKDEAGTIANGYVQLCLDGRQYMAHRMAWLYVYGTFPNGEIDHINRNKGDNRIENLRDVTKSTNQCNKKRMSNNTSGVTGVCWDKGTSKWLATISYNCKRIKLGRFNNFNDAVDARKVAEKKYKYLSD